MNVRFRILDAAEVPSILPLVGILNPALDPVTLQARLQAMLADGYRCLGGFEGDTLLAICGLWTGTKFYCGRYLEVDNVFVHPGQRSSGIGKAMMQAVEAIARDEGCDVLMLDTYVTNTRSHKFYLGQDFEIIGYHMNRNLDGRRHFPPR